MNYSFATRGNEKYALTSTSTHTMPQHDNEKNWYAFKVFFGKGNPIKQYFLSNNLEYFYDVERAYWDKKANRQKSKDVPVMPNLIFLHSTKADAEATERVFLNKIMLYREKNSDNVKIPSRISEREIRIFKIVATSGIEGLDFYDEYNPKFTQGDKFRVIDGPLKGAEGYVVRIKKDHRLYVSIKGLCAVTTGYIPKAFLEKIE